MIDAATFTHTYVPDYNLPVCQSVPSNVIRIVRQCGPPATGRVRNLITFPGHGKGRQFAGLSTWLVAPRPHLISSRSPHFRSFEKTSFAREYYYMAMRVSGTCIFHLILAVISALTLRA